MGLGKGKTEHSGARDMSRKHGHWGFTEEAKAWASRAAGVMRRTNWRPRSTSWRTMSLSMKGVVREKLVDELTWEDKP